MPALFPNFLPTDIRYPDPGAVYGGLHDDELRYLSTYNASAHGKTAEKNST